MGSSALSSIVLATAGRLQAIVNDGGLGIVKESDLRSALRDSSYPHSTSVAVEVAVQLPDWPRVGGVDVVIGGGANETLMAECKWCHDKDKLAETVWDVLKLASATAAGKASAGLIVAAASDAVWEHAPASSLFAERRWNLGEFITQFSHQWSWLFRSVTTARPRRLPATIEVTDLRTATIRCAPAGSWSLRAITVVGSPDGDLALDENGVPLHEYADPIDSDTEAAMQHDAAIDARAALARILHRTEAQAIFEDASIDETEKERRLVKLIAGLDPDAAEWPDAAGFLEALEMRRSIRGTDEQAP